MIFPRENDGGKSENFPRFIIIIYKTGDKTGMKKGKKEEK